MDNIEIGTTKGAAAEDLGVLCGFHHQLPFCFPGECCSISIAPAVKDTTFEDGSALQMGLDFHLDPSAATMLVRRGLD